MRIAKSVLYDKSRRVHVPNEIAEALELRPGIDRLFWTVDDGRIIIRKVSKQLAGPIEGCEDIEQRLKDYEERSSQTVRESRQHKTEVVIKVRSDCFFFTHSFLRRAEISPPPAFSLILSRFEYPVLSRCQQGLLP